MNKEVWTPIDSDTMKKLGIRCHFKGNTTTKYEARPLTDDEKRIMHQYANYAEAIQPSAYHLFNTATNRLTGADNVNPDYSGLYGAQARATAQNGVTANNLANGLLPQSFIDNRNAQAQNYAQNSMGSLLNDMASRGIINSSVTNSGIDSINKNLANAFVNSYTNDLGTASNLLGQSQDYANMPIAQANQAQQASYQLPLQLYGAATGQMQPTANIYTQATSSQNQSGKQTTSGGGGGGLFGSLLGIGLGNSSFGKSWF